MLHLKGQKRCSLLLLLGLLLGLAMPVSAQRPPGARLVSPSQTALSPRTDGRTVVWMDMRAGTRRDADIYAARLDGGPEIPVATGARQQDDPDVAGDLVVWAERPSGGYTNTDILGKDLATGQELTVAATPAAEGSPAISGRRVFWAQAGDPGASILMRDLATGAAPVTVVESTGGWYVDPGRGLAVDRDRIIWVEVDTDPSMTFPSRWRLVWRQAGGQPQVLAEGQITQEGFWSGVRRLDLAGDLVAYSTATEVVGANLRTGMAIRLAGRDISNVTTDGRYIFWVDTGETRISLWGYDTLAGSRFEVTSGSLGRLDAKAGMLVWSQTLEGPGSIFAATIKDVLPSARRLPPTTPGPSVRYFPETGHNLALGFKAFWERSGGLPIFGYPLTEEFDELNRDTGQMYTVQYFERQRYEYHPENRGTPYEVLLGRLGVEALQRAGRDWQSFPKAAPGAPHYFAETSHAIAPQFWEYWRSHGLEFGDRGVSFREALALFGYPISEPQMETNSSGDRVLTQWFERARFEYHPNNPDPYKVLLGRLAADQLADRGW